MKYYNVIEIEINNLTQDEKEKLVKYISTSYNPKIYINPDYESFEDVVLEYKDISDKESVEIKKIMSNLTKEEEEDLWRLYTDNVKKDNRFQFHLKTLDNKTSLFNDLDEVLQEYFFEYPAEFIDFQRSSKNSVYSKVKSQKNFQEKDYEDAINNLSSAEKDEIVDTIFRTVQWMEDDEFPQVWMSSVTDEDKEILKKYQELLKTTNEDDREDKIEEFEKDYQQISDFYNLDECLDDYLDSEFYLYKNNENFDDDGTKAELKFFKSKDKVIDFGVSEPRINSILFQNYKNLSPNYEINKWIDQHYQKETKTKTLKMKM